MNQGKWTDEDIAYLTKSYFSGKRLKIIVTELDRSEMGINKALQRFKIRAEREKKFSKNKMTTSS